MSVGTPYENMMEEIVADLRMDVVPALVESQREDAKQLAEIVCNAADQMQHTLTVLRMMRSVLYNTSGEVSRQTMKALEKVLESAPTVRTEQADILNAVAKGELK